MSSIIRIAVFLVLAAALSCQSRVNLNGQPTSLLTNFSGVFWSPDATSPDAFFVLMPIANVGQLMAIDPDALMDLNYGAGSWVSTSVAATEWAYFSPDACAHLPGPGYVEPMSLLTSTFDYGAYSGVTPVPFGLPNWTRFGGNNFSMISGLANSWDQERWELRTRGFFQTDEWNGCGPQPFQITPTFSGWVAVRFVVRFQ